MALKVTFLFLNVPREGGPPALESFLKNTIFFFTKSGQQVLKKVFAKWSQTYPTVKKRRKKTVFYQTWGREVFNEIVNNQYTITCKRACFLYFLASNSGRRYWTFWRCWTFLAYWRFCRQWTFWALRSF